MRVALIGFALLLLAGVWLAGKIASDPGYVMLAYGGTSIEMSLWVALAALLVLVLFVWLLRSVVLAVYRPLAASGGWWRDRNVRRSQRRSKRGLIAFIDGRWSDAARLLMQAAKESDAPLGSLLFAAKAAQQTGDYQRCDLLLAEAEALEDEEAVAVAAVKAQIYIDRDEWALARAALDVVRSEAIKHPGCLQLYARIYAHTKAWNDLRGILTALTKRGALPDSELLSWQEAMVMGLLDAAAHSKDPLDALVKEWKQLPSDWRDDASCVVHYAELLMLNGGHPKAETVLKGFLRTEWDRRVVDVFGRCRGSDQVRQLMLAESWLTRREKDPALLLALGRLSLQNQLWAKAKEYFVASVNAEANAAAFAELSRLCGSLGEWQKAAQYSKQALKYGLGELPTLPQPTAHK